LYLSQSNLPSSGKPLLSTEGDRGTKRRGKQINKKKRKKYKFLTGRKKKKQKTRKPLKYLKDEKGPSTNEVRRTLPGIP